MCNWVMGGGSVMVGRISMEVKRDRHVIDRPFFNAETYIRDIVEPYSTIYRENYRKSSDL